MAVPMSGPPRSAYDAQAVRTSLSSRAFGLRDFPASVSSERNRFIPGCMGRRASGFPAPPIIAFDKPSRKRPCGVLAGDVSFVYHENMVLPPVRFSSHHLPPVFESRLPSSSQDNRRLLTSAPAIATRALTARQIVGLWRSRLPAHARKVWARSSRVSGSSRRR